MKLVVGVDAGGTASRAVAATPDGTVIGRGHAGPGNLFAHGPAAAHAIAAAVRRALSGTDPAAVAGAVLGLAGMGACADPMITSALVDAWRSLGLTSPFTVVGDAVTAFAAGASEASGTVLIAGTGAVAAEIKNHEVVRTSDGLGWLLGDEGSGHWLGIRALRSAVRSWPSPFATTIAAHAGIDCHSETDGYTEAASQRKAGNPAGADARAELDALAAADNRAGADNRDRLIAWAQTLPHARIAALAPVVCSLSATGDPLAVAITDEAVRRLATTLDDLTADRPMITPPPTERPATPAGGPAIGGPAIGRPAIGRPDAVEPVNGRTEVARPVVLAGGLLVAPTPLRTGMIDVLRRRGISALTSGDPAVAAAWLALRRLSPADSAALHHRMLGERPHPSIL